jgi:hypothetical protein
MRPSSSMTAGYAEMDPKPRPGTRTVITRITRRGLHALR